MHTANTSRLFIIHSSQKKIRYQIAHPHMAYVERILPLFIVLIQIATGELEPVSASFLQKPQNNRECCSHN